MAIDPRLQPLLRQYEASRRQGRAMTATELCRDCPELLDDLEAILLPRYSTDPNHGTHAPSTPIMDTAHHEVRPQERLEIGHLTRRSSSEPVPGYHLIRRIGRGGFGEVWEATGDDSEWVNNEYQVITQDPFV